MRIHTFQRSCISQLLQLTFVSKLIKKAKKMDRKSIGIQLVSTLKIMGKSMMDAFQDQEPSFSFDQFMLLAYLNQNHQITQQELSVVLRKDKSVVLRQVAVLTHLNFIERLDDKQDKRKKLLVLTQKGKQLMTKMKVNEGHIWEELLKDIPEENLKVLSETLSMINNNKEFKTNI